MPSIMSRSDILNNFEIINILIQSYFVSINMSLHMSVIQHAVYLRKSLRCDFHNPKTLQYLSHYQMSICL